MQCLKQASPRQFGLPARTRLRELRNARELRPHFHARVQKTELIDNIVAFVSATSYVAGVLVHPRQVHDNTNVTLTTDKSVVKFIQDWYSNRSLTYYEVPANLFCFLYSSQCPSSRTGIFSVCAVRRQTHMQGPVRVVQNRWSRESSPFVTNSLPQQLPRYTPGTLGPFNL